MCSCDVGNEASAFGRKIRLARKQHRCCECRRPILPKEHYEYVGGIWDGQAESYKTCLRCCDMREAHIHADEASQVAELEVRRDRYMANHSSVTMMVIGGEKARVDAEGKLSIRHFGHIETCRPAYTYLRESVSECLEGNPVYRKAFIKILRDRRQARTRSSSTTPSSASAT